MKGLIGPACRKAFQGFRNLSYWRQGLEQYIFVIRHHHKSVQPIQAKLSFAELQTMDKHRSDLRLF